MFTISQEHPNTLDENDEENMTESSEEIQKKVASSLPPLQMKVVTSKGKRMRNSEISAQVLATYEQHRGLPATEYASKCLGVATSFTNKPWLQQVRQAMIIANKGVHKTTSGRPHLFVPMKTTIQDKKLPPLDHQSTRSNFFITSPAKG